MPHIPNPVSPILFLFLCLILGSAVHEILKVLQYRIVNFARIVPSKLVGPGYKYQIWYTAAIFRNFDVHRNFPRIDSLSKH